MRHKRVSRQAAVLIALAILALAAGCGSDSDSATSTAAAGADASSVAPATKRAAELERGLSTEPPSSGPRAQPRKKVWAISCGDIVESCKLPTDAQMEAGKTLGWSMKRADAAFEPAQAAEAIRQAIVDDADAILVSAFDCVQIKAPLREAKKAGVVTYGAGATDCDDPVAGDGSESLYTFVDQLPPDSGQGYANFLRTWGGDKANYVIAARDGKVKAINLEQTDIPNVALISRGFDEQLDECAGCEVVETVKFTGADVENGNLAQAVSNALAGSPDATVVHMPYDGLAPVVAPAINESGRSRDLLVMGGEGFASNLEMIRKGGAQDAALAQDIGWQSWAQLDDLNRHFADQKPVNGGWAYAAVDADTNLPKSGGWDSMVDYRSAYRKVWGR